MLVSICVPVVVLRFLSALDAIEDSYIATVAVLRSLADCLNAKLINVIAKHTVRVCSMQSDNTGIEG